MNGSFLIARVTDDGTIPYRGAVAHIESREEAFKRLEAVKANNSAKNDYVVLRVYRAKSPASAARTS